MHNNELLLASNNQKKIEELRAMLSPDYIIFSLKDLGIEEGIPETENTFQGNALLKATFLAEKYKRNVIADDSGLEVDALNGAPGVFSARFAGQPTNDENNTNKLLADLKGNINRKAQFKTVIALVKDEMEYFFEGTVQGTITTEKQGKEGFGYDPVFIPNGYDKTFAELGKEVKNKISHRANAVSDLRDFLLR
jgi:XTP/dITP diphosphohydrolase